MKRILSFIISISMLTISYAQERFNGSVVNENALPLAGATIRIQDSNVIQLSLEDGSFSIEAKKGDILEISFVGYQSATFKIEDTNWLSVVLKTNSLTLEDVVITGYTSQRIRDITGSVAVVKAKDLIAYPAGQAEQMLQGRVAGLTVITSGMPGGASNVRIHGIGNFGDVTPLYIIDGVQGDINALNPDDIESLQVLKDAGAYAIYGVRGANGVIVVTTKSGKTGKTKLNYDFYIGATRPLKKGADLLNPQEQADLTWMAKRNSNQLVNGNPQDPLYGNGTNPVLPDYFIAGQNLGIPAGDPAVDPALYSIDYTQPNVYQIIKANKAGTDWFHELFKPAITQNHSISASGGNEKNKYLFSLGYLDQQGTLLNTYLKRFTVRLNTVFAINDHIRIGENLQLSYRDNPQIGTQRGPNENEIAQSLYTPTILPVYDINGGWASFSDDNFRVNPVARRIISRDDKTNYWETLGNAWVEANFLKNFTIKTQFGGSFTNYYLYNFILEGYTSLFNHANNGFYETSGYRRSWTWTNTLNYTRTFRDIHAIKILVGTEVINNYNRELGGSKLGYFTNDPNYRFLSNGTPQTETNYSFAGISALSSFLSRIDYALFNKYLFTATLRNDGSSVFSSENRFGWFPSISAAWRLSEESFMKSMTWLTDFKLRASWGKTGFYGNTDPLNQFNLYGGGPGDAYYDIRGTGNSIVQGFRQTRIGDARTGWQEDVVSNLGFESVFLKGRLSITADLFRKESKGLLLPITLPDILGGATPPNANLGNMLNTGFDLLVGSKGNFSKKFSWDGTLTFTTYKNRIVHLTDAPYEIPDFDQAGPGLVRNEVGYPVGSFYGMKIIGFFNDQSDIDKSPPQAGAAPGRFKYLDANLDGKVDDKDRVHFGNPNPKFTLGLNIGLNYSSFDFSIFCYGSFGNEVLNISRVFTDFYLVPLRSDAKSKTLLYDSWSPQHTNAKAPIAENDANYSNIETINSYPLENGSYFRGKMLMLGYTVPATSHPRLKIDRLRFYVQALNLFTITKYTGLDPELSGHSAAFGIDFGNYPDNQKQFLIGLNFNF